MSQIESKTMCFESDFDWTCTESFWGSLNGVEIDSRKVMPGFLFLAYPGEKTDGRHFIPSALKAGCAAVLWESTDFVWDLKWQVPHAAVRNLRKHVGEIISRFYGDPSQKMWITGVTGTNGKTSCAYWLASAMNILARKAGVIGTLGVGTSSGIQKTLNTTPDPVSLHRALNKFETTGLQNAVVEVSSHALEQQRVNAIAFDVALFTNLTREHLDYHGSMKAYARAKYKLLEWETLKYAVINVDDKYGYQFASDAEKAGIDVIRFGMKDADVVGKRLKLTTNGISLGVSTPWGEGELNAKVLGIHNAYNLLGVIGVMLVSGIELEQVFMALKDISAIPGRMQTINSENLPSIVVDYAHTSDALELTLLSLRKILKPQNKILCVFGCGGGRDKGKRAPMGEIATKIADFCVFTSDNPRLEDPKSIIDDIKKRAGTNYRTEIDRAAAIRWAIFKAAPGDLVLIAGKGHEATQQIGDLELPFVDIEIAKHALNERKLRGDRANV